MTPQTRIAGIQVDDRLGPSRTRPITAVSRGAAGMLSQAARAAAFAPAAQPPRRRRPQTQACAGRGLPGHPAAPWACRGDGQLEIKLLPAGTAPAAMARLQRPRARGRGRGSEWDGYKPVRSSAHAMLRSRARAATSAGKLTRKEAAAKLRMHVRLSSEQCPAQSTVAAARTWRICTE